MKRKIKIIPAILEKKFSKIEEKIKRAESAKVKMVQIDICDGNLTSTKTFASSGLVESFKKLKKISEKIDLELDMIVHIKNRSKGEEDKFLESIKYLKPKRVIFHFSGVSDWDEIFEELKGKKIKIALGIWLSNDTKKVNKILEKYKFDYIQIMGIEKVGYGGQKISEKVFKKAKYFFLKYPNLNIQVDGGVKLKNSQKLFLNGVSNFVVGSDIYGVDNIEERIKEFKKEIR